MNGISFSHPLFLLLITLIPVVIWKSQKLNINPALSLGSLPTEGILKPSLISRLGYHLDWLKYLTILLMIIALAGPRQQIGQSKVMTEGIDIMLAVDVSGSMAALDFKLEGEVVNRLMAARHVLENFIRQREGDRIGLVVFGSHAYTQVPLTRDYQIIANALEHLQIGDAGKQTAIGDAIGISLKRLADVRAKSKIIILLTDGRSNSGQLSPEAVTEIARKQKIKIYTIGIGSQGEKVPFVVNHPLLGQQISYQQVDIDTQTLEEIAKATGGLYFNAQNTQGLEKTYAAINRLEKSRAEVKTFNKYKALQIWFLVPCLVLLCLYIILANTRFLKIP